MQQALEVLVQSVLVLLNETVNVVDDIAGVVSDAEVLAMLQLLVGGLQLATGIVGMLAQVLVHGPQQRVIGDLAHAQAGLVHNGDDALVGLLHQIANYLELKIKLIFMKTLYKLTPTLLLK